MIESVRNGNGRQVPGVFGSRWMKMNLRQTALYADLCSMQITQSGVALSFEARLARENGWDLAKSISVVDEYRKFLFLMLEAGHPVTPSDQIDQAWHLHLLYTESYWNDLCQRIAGRALHHSPTAGGSSERARYTDWYDTTKESYRTFFGTAAPLEVWPEASVRFGEDVQFQRVNLARNLVIPRPGYWLRRGMARLRGLFGEHRESTLKIKSARNSRVAKLPPVSIAPLFIGQLNPLNFNGPGFLVFYVFMMIIGGSSALVLRWLFRQRDAVSEGKLREMGNSLTPEQVAFLAHGPKGPVDVAIARLSQEGNLWADMSTMRLRSQFTMDHGRPVLEKAILSATSSGHGQSITGVRKACGSVVDSISGSLKSAGLVESFSGFLLPRISALAVLSPVLLLGLSKVVVGVGRGKPVGFLVLLILLTVAMLTIICIKPRLTLLGERVLHRLKQDFRELRKSLRQVGAPDEVPGSADMAMSVAILGVAGISSTIFDQGVLDLLKRDRSSPLGDGGISSGGCGGGDGGCSGGGCGGCGS